MPRDTANTAAAAARADTLSRARQAYWRFNVRLIAVLLTLGAIVSFGVPLVAEQLKQVRFAGWSLPFYIGAQGAIVVYLVLVLVYIVAMHGADRRLRQVLGDETAPRHEDVAEAISSDPYAQSSDTAHPRH